MSVKEFFTHATRLRTTETVGRIERGTSAEIVVAMRHRIVPAGRGIATAAALAGLATFAHAWWSPRVYLVDFMPLEVLVGAALGALVGWQVPAVSRSLTPRSMRRTAALAGARDAFVHHGVDRTRDRTGILVLAAVYDHEVAIVADEGVPEGVVRETLEPLAEEMRGALRSSSVTRFLELLEGLSPRLATALPRRDDDSNELCDAPI